MRRHEIEKELRELRDFSQRLFAILAGFVLLLDEKGVVSKKEVLKVIEKRLKERRRS